MPAYTKSTQNNKQENSIHKEKPIASWAQLKRIGASNLAKSTVLAPFFGYLVVYNDSVASFLTSMYDGRISELLGTTHDTYIISVLTRIFLGLVAVGIASIIYKLCCPQEIDNYNDYLEYFQSELDAASELRLYRLKQEVMRPLNPSQTVELSKYIEILTAEDLSKHVMQVAGPHRNITWSTWLDKNRDAYSTIARLYYDQLNASRLPARWTAAILYLSGFALVLWPSIKVCTAALKSLIL